jgi:magnesium-transporting ATPase (P-type)
VILAVALGPRRATRGPGHLKALARQFTHALALLLWAAAFLALVSGTPVLGAAILAVIALNAVFAFVQELQAERAAEALREFLPLRARVRRDGEPLEIDAAELVPGDILLLEEGDRCLPSVLNADDTVFAGTLCTAGDAVAVVYATGMDPARPYRGALAAATRGGQPAPGTG